MAKLVSTQEPTCVLEFTLPEAKRIMELAEYQAKECGNWFIVNTLSELAHFVRQQGGTIKEL